jgi:hypothetical protein
MRKLQAILATVLFAGLLAGCIVVDRPDHDGYYWHYYHYDRD